MTCIQHLTFNRKHLYERLVGRWLFSLHLAYCDDLWSVALKMHQDQDTMLERHIRRAFHVRDFTCEFRCMFPRAAKCISLYAWSHTQNRDWSIDLFLTYPMHTSFVKDCTDIPVTPIASIVNLSLSEGCFPSHFKSALVSPLLKKPTLKDKLKPVSNFSFLFKILEKFVAFLPWSSKKTNSFTLLEQFIDACEVKLFYLQGHAHHVHIAWKPIWKRIYRDALARLVCACTESCTCKAGLGRALVSESIIDWSTWTWEVSYCVTDALVCISILEVLVHLVRQYSSCVTISTSIMVAAWLIFIQKLRWLLMLCCWLLCIV